jgi:hypothetical protein
MVQNTPEEVPSIAAVETQLDITVQRNVDAGPRPANDRNPGLTIGPPSLTRPSWR